MKKYIVSLDGIISANKTDIELSLINLELKKIANNDSMFSLESALDGSVSLDAHIDNILTDDNVLTISKILPQIDKLYLNVGVLYDTATCTVILPNKSMVKLLTAFPQIYVRTVCYPCEEAENSK